MTIAVSTTALRATRRSRRLARPHPWLLVLVSAAALGAAVVLTGQAPRDTPAGLPDAGRLTAWVVLLSRTGMRIAAVGTVGCLLVAAYLVPADHPEARATTGALARAAARWSLAWAVSTFLLMVSSSAQLLGTPLQSALTTYAVWDYVPQLAQGRALMLMAPMVLLIAFHARSVRSRHGLQLLLALALLALAPLSLTGHAATAGSHYLATQSLLLHVLAVTLWFGGLVGLLHVRREALDVRLVSRFSPVALACFGAVAVTGLLAASSRLDPTVRAWTSAYGVLVLVKLTGFVLLGLAGWWHRRRTIPDLAAGRSWAFWRVVGVEVILMSAATGLAVALSRTAPPVRAGVVVAPHPASTVDRGLAEVSPLRLLTDARPQALMVTLVAAVTLLHLAAARRRVRSGQRDAWRAAAWFLGGSLVLLWALCGGLAPYGSAILSGHVAQLLVCALVVPRLWARGVRGLTPPPGGSPPYVALRLPTLAPMDGALVLALGLSAVYGTPLLERSLRSGSVHLAVDAAALVVGAACAGWIGLAATPGDADVRRRGTRLAAFVLAAFGVAMALSPHVFAETWFDSLDWSWSDPAADQRYAALLILATALLLYAGQVNRSHGLRRPGGTADPHGTTSARAAR